MATVMTAVLTVACSSTGDQTTAVASSDLAPSSQQSSSQTPTSQAPSDQTSSDRGPMLGPEVFQGQATTSDGQSFDLATLANKDLVIWFWAPW